MLGSTKEIYTIKIYVNGTLEFESKFSTLREIDERTVEYENEQQLISEIEKRLKRDYKGKNVKVKIAQYVNKADGKYYEMDDILYSSDKEMFNDEKVRQNMIGRFGEKEFMNVITLRYKSKPGIGKIVEKMEQSWNNQSEYFFYVNKFLDYISNYKSYRKAYIDMKNYNNDNFKRGKHKLYKPEIEYRKKTDENCGQITFFESDEEVKTLKKTKKLMR